MWTNWPQVVAESHVRAAGALVARADLPERIHAAAEMAARPRRKEEPIRLDEFIARIERELVRRALARSKGNKAKARGSWASTAHGSIGGWCSLD